MWRLEMGDLAEGTEFHPMIHAAAKKVEGEHGVTIRSMDKKNLENEVRGFMDVYNEAWGDNWGFVPITDAEVEFQAKNLKPVLDEDWAFIAERDGEVVGAALTLPDINQVLKKMNGRLLPFGWWHFLTGRRKIDRVRVFALGVKPQYQHLGIAASFYIRHIETTAPTGSCGVTPGWILETNEPMNRAMEGMGGEVVKRYRIYEKDAVVVSRLESWSSARGDAPLAAEASGGGVARVVNGVIHRLLHVDGTPIVVRAWQQPSGEMTLRAEGLDEAAGREQLELAIERMRFALGVDDDMSGFYDAFKRDPLLGPVIIAKPWIRPRRLPLPWEALLRAITKQLIEASRAADIERRIVRRWGIGAAGLLDPPDRRRSPSLPRPSWSAATSPRAAPWRWSAPPARRPPAAPTSRARTRTAACWRSARSGRGRSSAWGSTAAATPTRCPPATSATSSWSGAWPGSAAAQRSRRSRSSSPPTSPTAASPAPSPWSGSTS